MQSGAGRLARNSIDCSIAMILLTRAVLAIHQKSLQKSIDMANGANVLLQTILALDKT
jgi:hypothetical protein